MGVNVWEMPHGLEVQGHKVCVLLCGLEVEGQNVCVLLHRLGGPVDVTGMAIRGPAGSEHGFGALGG
jgi:hypothetical protein